jgi:hypothetical protein
MSDVNQNPLGYQFIGYQWRSWSDRRATGISVTFIQGGPPGYFTHISITTPIVSALKNYYI